MGKVTLNDWAKSGDVPPLEGAFVTGANLRSSSKTKSTPPPRREEKAQTVAPVQSSRPKTRDQ